MQERRSIGQMLVLHRHSGLSAVERHEERNFWSLIHRLLQGIAAVAVVVSMLHPIMVEALAFIRQLIVYAYANSLRTAELPPRRVIDQVYLFL